MKPSPAIIALLCAVLRGEGHVDLGSLLNFSKSDICSIISKLQESREVISLNLSKNFNINEIDLVGVLSPRSPVETIYLLSDPQISLKTILSIAKSPKSRLCNVHHPKMFKRPFQREFNIGQSIIEQTKYVQDSACSPYPPAPNRLARAIWVCVEGKPNQSRKPKGTDGRKN